MINSRIESFSISFSKESVLCQSKMTITPGKMQKTICSIIEQESENNPIYGEQSDKNLASPLLVNRIFSSFGYTVETCPQYEKVLQTEQQEDFYPFKTTLEYDGPIGGDFNIME